MTLFLLTAICLFQGDQQIIEELIVHNPFDASRSVSTESQPELLESIMLTADSTEDDLSLYIRQKIAQVSKNAGVDINSINVRKSKVINEDTGQKVLHIYFGWNSEFGPLLNLFQGLNQLDTEIAMESLTISARRRPSRRDMCSETLSKRKSLNGNAIVSVLWPLNQPTPIGEAYYHYDLSVPDLLHRITLDLPNDIHLTHIQIKNGSQITLQGEAGDPNEVKRSLEQSPVLTDLQPGNAITTCRNRDGKRRFLYKANLNFDEL